MDALALELVNNYHADKMAVLCVILLVLEREHAGREGSGLPERSLSKLSMARKVQKGREDSFFAALCLGIALVADALDAGPVWTGLKRRYHDPKRLLAHFVIRYGL